MDSTPLPEFRPFTRLPLEIQLMIIERALPKPEIVDICVSMRPEENGIRSLFVFEPRFPDPLPLLMACKLSNFEILRSYQRIEMVIPVIPSVFRIISNDFIFQQKHTYIRARVDTLLLQSHPLISIYKEGGHLLLGGRVNLSGITSLALDNAIIRDLHNIPSNDEAMMRKQAELYTLLSVHFPSLKELFLLIEGECGGRTRFCEPQINPICESWISRTAWWS